MTKINTEIKFLCDGCPADLTGLPHLRIVINHMAGKRVPPFNGPFPEIPVACRDVTLHGCDGKCLGRAIERLVHESANAPVNNRIEIRTISAAVVAKPTIPEGQGAIVDIPSDMAPKPALRQNRGFLARILSFAL